MPPRFQSVLLGLALLGAASLWLLVSSDTADALHQLVKDGYRWDGFGSVSIRLIVATYIWSAAASYLLVAVGNRKLPQLRLTAAIIGGISLITLVVTAIGDTFLQSIGVAAVGVWIAEVAIGSLLAWRLSGSKDNNRVRGALWSLLAAFTWLMFAKAVFLAAAPGIAIRLS